jgi:hypothetical protein
MGRTTWIDPTTLKHYNPSDRQAAFHDIALEAAVAGVCWKADWVRRANASGLDEFTYRPMTLSEYNSWAGDRAFSAWFYSDFDELHTPDEDEMKMLDRKFWRGLSSGMDAGREWSFKVFAKVRWGEGGVNQNKDRTDLDSFLNQEGGAEGWSTAEA